MWRWCCQHWSGGATTLFTARDNRNCTLCFTASSVEWQVYNISFWPTPQTSASAFQKVNLSVISMPKQESAGPTRHTVALLQPEQGAIAAASTLTHFTWNFKSWGDAIQNTPGNGSLQRRNGDSPCAPCRWRSLHRCRRLHRNPRYMGNYTRAAPAALG